MLDLDAALYLSGVMVWLFLFYKYVPSQEDSDSKNNSRKTSKSSVTGKGNALLTSLGLTDDNLARFHHISDYFSDLDELSSGLQRCGLRHCRLVIGLDFTASNEWQGRRTFNGQCLHKLSSGRAQNPYQKVISVLGETLQPLFATGDDISAYGFGDSSSMDQDVFPLREDGQPCADFYEVLSTYNSAVGRVRLSGPTSFAPLIRQTMGLVRRHKQYTILVIVADGQVTEEEPTVSAIIAASQLPLSIVMVGVGDGPWDSMHEFDDRLPQRRFDNFQFVDYHASIRKAKNADSAFALQALMEIPDQYREVTALGYLE